jgi:uncharacterized protein YsxB (DUF464 family)
MTKVTIYKNREGYISRFRIEGHSGYDVKGKDIVCAAVSVLAQTVLIALVEVLNINEELIDYSIDEDIGLLDVRIPTDLSHDDLDRMNILLKTFEIGIKSIIDGYSEYVTLIYKEV